MAARGDAAAARRATNRVPNGMALRYCPGPALQAPIPNRGCMAFDRNYYQRFYYDPRTAVTTRMEVKHRARMIAAHADYIGLPVRRILDAGCGTGMLKAPLLRQMPRAQYTGMETSEDLCAG